MRKNTKKYQEYEIFHDRVAVTLLNGTALPMFTEVNRAFNGT